MNEQELEYLLQQEDSNLRSAANQTALRAAAEHKERTVHNEAFLNELRDPDLKPEDPNGEFDFNPEEQFKDWFSGAHAVTNRGDSWDQQADLLMMNKRERAIAERRPGRLLRTRPWMLAAMRGDESPPAEAYDIEGIPYDADSMRMQLAGKDTTESPISSQEMSRIYGGAEVAADLMSLSRNAAGLESVSTVKTETNVRREEEDESTTSRLGRFME
jgi:hypothetical protein